MRLLSGESTTGRMAENGYVSRRAGKLNLFAFVPGILFGLLIGLALSFCLGLKPSFGFFLGILAGLLIGVRPGFRHEFSKSLNVTILRTRSRFFCAALMLFSVAFIVLRCIGGSIMLNDLLINEGVMDIPYHSRYVSSEHLDNRNGIAIMEQASVVVVGLIGPTSFSENPAMLKSLVGQITQIGSLFRETNVVLSVGNVSRPVEDILTNWKENSSFGFDIIPDAAANGDLATTGHGVQKRPREEMLSVYRNQVLNFVRSHYNQSQYMIVIDLDVVGWDINGIVNSFGHQSTNWDVMCSRGITAAGTYRDVYAFRDAAHGIHTNHHFFSYISTINQPYRSSNTYLRHLTPAYLNYTRSKSKVIALMSPWRYNSFDLDSTSMNLVRSDSCFGGLAIYRLSALNGCEYSAKVNFAPDVDGTDCEHVSLHRCMRQTNAAAIYTNPSMKLWYGHGILSMSPAMLMKKSKQFLMEKISFLIPEGILNI